MDGLNEIFLIECMKENLAHARHVENERMMFNSIFAALVGGSLAIASQLNDKIIIVTIIGILMMVNIICLTFTKRWNKVFKNHYALAQKIYLSFLNMESPTAIDAGEKNQDINRLYYFDNRLNENPVKTYISTGKYFIIYNTVIFVLLTCSLFYFISY